jgi:hypothetical protein
LAPVLISYKIEARAHSEVKKPKKKQKSKKETSDSTDPDVAAEPAEVRMFCMSGAVGNLWLRHFRMSGNQMQTRISQPFIFGR